MTTAVRPDETRTVGPERGVERYRLVERVIHWEVAITFTALMLSGLALGYPRMFWLANLFGGGQTMRVAHPWIGISFTLGIAVMAVMWASTMRFNREDRRWFRTAGTYARTGHSPTDTGKWNAGQKAYFWLAVVTAVVLLASGIPLWFPNGFGVGVVRWSRFTHHATFLVAVGGYIIHVLLSAFMFEGTMDSMTTGRVSRAWAAWHHPRWFRQRIGNTATEVADTHRNTMESPALAESTDPPDPQPLP